jgi:hypothetical protein
MNCNYGKQVDQVEEIMVKKTDLQTSASPFDVRVLWDINGRSLEFAETTYRAWLEGTRRMQNEAMDFWRASAAKNSAAASDIAKCTTAAEAFEMQSKCVQENFTDLLGEGRRMADMFGELVRENVTMFDKCR